MSLLVEDDMGESNLSVAQECGRIKDKLTEVRTYTSVRFASDARRKAVATALSCATAPAMGGEKCRRR